MLEYIICSGIACYGSSKLFAATVNATADDLGYVCVGERKKVKPSKRILNFALSFIPGLSSIIALYFFGLSLYLAVGDKQVVEGVFKNNPRYVKASVAKELLEKRQASYDLGVMEDAMKLDGASTEVIVSEKNKVKDEGVLPTTKEMKKIRAMSDAEEWLLSIELDANLDEKEKEELYRLYVKDLSKNNSNGKAIQKTLKMVNNKKD